MRLTRIRAPDFDPEKTLNSGQVFHWEKVGDGFVGTIGDRALYLEQRDELLKVRFSEPLTKSPRRLLPRLSEFLFRVIWRVWRIIKILRLKYGNEMAQLIFDVAGCSNGVGNLLSQQRLVTLPESVEGLSDRILSHTQACGDLCL